MHATLFFLSVSMFSGFAHTADIRSIAQTWILLEGQIEKGDYDKIFKIAELGLTEGIYLFSPGGDVVEAMKIGRLVRSLRWTTNAPLTQMLGSERAQRLALFHGVKDPMRNNLCASACFFVHVAGIYRWGDTLLIHRPYLSDAELRKLSGDQVLRISQVARTETDAYLKEMGLPAKYSELMYSVPKDQVQLLAESDIKTDLYGFIPELKDWVDARCEKTTGAERIRKNNLVVKPPSKWTAEEKEFLKIVSDKEDETIKCWKDVQGQMRIAAWCDAIGREKGWCPRKQ